MPRLSDGLLLMRIAEDVADLGAEDALTDESARRLGRIVRDPGSVALVAARLDSPAKAEDFLSKILERLDRRDRLADDDERHFVAGTAALGSLLVHAAADPAAEAFEAAAS